MRIAAMVIFVLGFSGGALSFNAYRAWARSHSEGSRRAGFDNMLDQLQLNDDQKAQVHQILGETRQQLQALRQEQEPRVNEIRKQTDERLQKVLSPEQWKKFQQRREESRGRRRGRD